MSVPRPKIRLPLWAAVAVAVAAYVFRSVVRGFDFGLDVPEDLIAFGVFALAIAAVAYSRRTRRDEREDQAAEEEHDEDLTPAGG